VDQGLCVATEAVPKTAAGVSSPERGLAEDCFSSIAGQGTRLPFLDLQSPSRTRPQQDFTQDRLPFPRRHPHGFSRKAVGGRSREQLRSKRRRCSTTVRFDAAGPVPSPPAPSRDRKGPQDSITRHGAERLDEMSDAEARWIFDLPLDKDNHRGLQEPGQRCSVFVTNHSGTSRTARTDIISSRRKTNCASVTRHCRPFSTRRAAASADQTLSGLAISTHQVN